MTDLGLHQSAHRQINFLKRRLAMRIEDGAGRLFRVDAVPGLFPAQPDQCGLYRLRNCRHRVLQRQALGSPATGRPVFVVHGVAYQPACARSHRRPLHSDRGGGGVHYFRLSPGIALSLRIAWPGSFPHARRSNLRFRAGLLLVDLSSRSRSPRRRLFFIYAECVLHPDLPGRPRAHLPAASPRGWPISPRHTCSRSSSFIFLLRLCCAIDYPNPHQAMARDRRNVFCGIDDSRPPLVSTGSFHPLPPIHFIHRRCGQSCQHKPGK